MPTVQLNPEHPDPSVLARAGAIVRSGGLVAFPTETVYGLGANALDEGAIRRVFAAKGRPAFNPLIAHVGDLSAAREISALWPALAEELGARFWPGPLTLVVPKRPDIPDSLTAGLSTVAIRVPAHPVARGLIEAARLPIAAPSANRYTELSPTSARHVEKGLGDRVDLILDAGPTEHGIESTVVDLSGAAPALLRPGTISRSILEAVVGPLDVRAEPGGPAARPSPGMIERHYSPRAAVMLLRADQHEPWREAVDAANARGARIGALLLGDVEAGIEEAIAMPRDPAGYARRLYAALHHLDDRGCDLILVHEVPDEPEWAGIRDRLARAAAKA
jgi:L-threonylcarbamoyladenylate synthase